MIPSSIIKNNGKIINPIKHKLPKVANKSKRAFDFFMFFIIDRFAIRLAGIIPATAGQKPSVYGQS